MTKNNKGNASEDLALETHSPNKQSLSQQEPIAIIGMACRFPGSRDLSEFWQQLVSGQNAVVEGPPKSVIGRAGQYFPESSGKVDALRYGAFVEDLDRFDAEFFRISPIEAQMLDPQQRMMLEVSWQALEDAAIDPESLKGSRTGVYAGISNYDYREMAIYSPETAEATGGLYSVTGTALNTAIGRVSFSLGLEGPALAIDTACSSSLVAIHQAIAGLQGNDTDLAIAGGVHIVLSGHSWELRANAGMLSPTGQCWTFDASADGFVCGEGCGLLVLKLLSKAQADGDRIWAVIRGSSVNQDGASQGLTVPSAPSQEKAIEEALARAGIQPSDMDYLEAHGTGTVVGDPIELNAATAVYGRGRGKENPLLIGSVKTNIGHLGPAAGVAGLIKSVLAMRQGIIPRHLNFKNPNPRIDWDNLPVRVTDENTLWPPHPDRPPVAGVNSFGWSGTNAHVVVEGYGPPVNGASKEIMAPPLGAEAFVPISLPDIPPSHSDDLSDAEIRETRFLPLSGKSPESIRDLASSYLHWLDSGAEELSSDNTAASPLLADLAWTAAVGRSHFPYRSGVAFSNVGYLRERLHGLTNGNAETGAQAPRGARKVAFVFTGQGSQWVNMGRTLYEREPVFRAVLDQCDRLLFEERRISLLDVIFGRNDTGGLLDEPAWTQPAIYSLECALTALWESVGIKPDVVVGHSLGEIAASQAAGVFTLEQGLRFASARGTLLGGTRNDGAMAAVFAPASRVASVVAEHNITSDDVGLSVAVDNGLQQVVSGPAKDLEAVLKVFEAEEIKVRRLKRSPAYHSALMEPALDDLAAAVRDIAGLPPAPSVPLLSDMNGRPVVEYGSMDASYWRRHAREPVAFRSCVETLAEMKVDVVVEVGPHAILGPVVSMTWPDSAPAGPPVVLQSLRRPPRDPDEPVIDTSGGFVQAAAGAYEAGLDLKFEGLFAGESRRKVAIPTYPFNRKHYWVSASKRKRQDSGHALLGTRHESPHGEVMFETEMFPSDPPWMVDHLVYERIVAPGGMYGAMAVAASLIDGSGPAVVDEMQTHSALIFEDEDSDDPSKDVGRKLQFVLDGSEDPQGRRFEIFSKGANEEEWTLHAEGRLSSNVSFINESRPIDVDAIKVDLECQDPADFYRMRSADAIYLGPSYHTLKAIWATEGESLGELALQDFVDGAGIEMHPLLLDGCFQVLSLARHLSGIEHGAVYMPFGWERLWVSGPMPERILCHATLRQPALAKWAAGTSTSPPEVITGDVNFYSTSGEPIGGLKGFTVKRATRAALLSPTENLKELLYEVVWQKNPLSEGMSDAGFLTSPNTIASQSRPLSDYLIDQGVKSTDRSAFLENMERLSLAFVLSALEKLGWKRKAGEFVTEEDLRGQLRIIEDHQRLLGRLLNMLTEAGILTPSNNGYVVKIGADDPLPDPSLANPEALAERLAQNHPHGINELGLLRRCGSSLAKVLQGREDPLGLLFNDQGPSAADLYLKAPASRAASKMLGDVVSALVAALPDDRQLKVIEVGAGTGSATESILPLLPAGSFDYTFTDISAAFFAKAEARLALYGAPIEYKTLNIETDPVAQGFDAHAYDLVIAANVLHATRDLGETLANCRELLAPSGQLIALEGLQRRAYQDLTFGLLDGWWRFADSYRPDHALATPAAWEQALEDAGFSDTVFIGTSDPHKEEPLGSSVILARGPARIALSPGAWVLAADEAGIAQALAAELTALGQTVVLAREDEWKAGGSEAGDRVSTAKVYFMQRDSWREVMEELPKDLPLKGIVHLAALDGHGASADTGEMAHDVTRATGSALALVQGIIDAGAMPTHGIWFVTQGAQVLEQDLIQRASGQLAGAALWGLGKVVAGEAAHLHPRMIDLDHQPRDSVARLLEEVLYPDAETHIAYRSGGRLIARLVRGVDERRLPLPEDIEWSIGPEDPKAGLTDLRTKRRSRQALEPGEVRIAVESMGLNFADIVVSMGAVEDDKEIGREVYGRILETADGAEGLSVGDRVVAIGFGGFAPEMVVGSTLVAPVPEGFAPAALASMPISFVTADIAFQLSALKGGERVLVHAGAGGVGLAAIQLAQALDAEVFVTASSPKQPYLRALGIKHVFDSRQTKFAEEVLHATEGKGVDVVLNSLTGEGFIKASLSCLAERGRFVEIAKRNIYSKEQMTTARPDVDYHILAIDALKRTDPAIPGTSLKGLMKRFSSGELSPLPHTLWPLPEIRSAFDVMRNARHIGKNVLSMPPLAAGPLRKDRTYLVTGGMGGIGCEVARWLADNGAETIVLNGRRDPDPTAELVIAELRQNGADIRVEIADVTDFSAVDDMLARIDEALPTLGGIIHSVGVLSDGAIENQTWERFEQVMWPKVLGAWHLHKATIDKDLDMFILFSSVTGVIGNPGQSNHAAANAFLDQLAAHRRMLGLPAQSIAWGAWSGIGEAEEQRERIERQLESTGAGWIAPQQGIKALDWLVRHDVTTPTLTTVDWSVLTEEGKDLPPFFEDLMETRKTRDPKPEAVSPSSGLMSQLRNAPDEERQTLIAAFIQEELKGVMRLASPPSATVSFFDLGMDSLMAVELRNRINRALAGEYTASNTVVFDYPNASTLAGHLAKELGALSGSAPTPPKIASPIRPRVHGNQEAIAIVGMACRFPDAPDIDSFWRLLEEGRSAIAEGRRDEGAWEGVLGDPNAREPLHRRGAFVDDIDLFDSRFFKISPIEARLMDPQQRMLLETAWHALEDAGIDPDRLRGSRTGIFAGVASSEYRDVLAARGQEYNYAGTNSAVTVGRVAFALGLQGPALAVDVACASSLAALHQGVAGLQRGEVDMALAGGVNAILSPRVTDYLNEMGMLSRSGACRAFDAAADGFIRGEGCGIVVLKRLSDAEADGDRIWGVLLGSAVNQNGMSAGFMAPNGPAQERVMEDALIRAGINAADIDYLEAHGLGSQFGDPIEVNAAAEVYAKGRDADHPLLIGSVKTNIGHLEWASGIASLIKILLAMKKGVMPRHLHFNDPSPHFDWDRQPVRVTSKATPWPATPDRPPLAAVNSFGLSGANAHVIVEGYPGQGSHNQTVWPAGPALPAPSTGQDSQQISPRHNLEQPRTRLLPLSGKTPNALRDLSHNYSSWLNGSNGDHSSELTSEYLADIAWTAGIGRSHFPHRAGVVFSNVAELGEHLTSLANGASKPDDRDPLGPTKTAFMFTGYDGAWLALGRRLYETEPIAREILDHCARALLKEHGRSLLDVIREEGSGDVVSKQAAIYALECALAALWKSVGISPNVVLGGGLGLLSAAQTAGAFDLEYGLMIAATVDTASSGADAQPFTSLSLGPPAAPIVIGSNGRVLQSHGAPEASRLEIHPQAHIVPSASASSLAALGVDAIVEIGAGSAIAEDIRASWSVTDGDEEMPRMPSVLAGLQVSSGNPNLVDGDSGFPNAVARAYEAGFDIAFPGLFIGEMRRRVALPGYPFQRRRHWVDPPGNAT